ncbi:hypothetical protein [Sagittula sp. S175]|uniref:hypothetical protein n=1 Tax=Sagittula sp. S175 TaxID=3415129 RepID=UPI003C7B83D1
MGNNVSRFSVGDAVFGEAGLKFGGNASHICLGEAGVLMKKPDGLSHEDAAVMCDGPLTSLNVLREVAELRAGQKTLIRGASGSFGQPRERGSPDCRRNGGRGDGHLQRPQCQKWLSRWGPVA